MSRREGVQSFKYGNRQRYAYLPTIGFLVVLFVILAADPSLLWSHSVDEQTRRIALALDGAMAMILTGAVALRWTEPYQFVLDGDGLVVIRMIGPVIRVPYDHILMVVERPRTFVRSQAELDITIAGVRKPVCVREGLKDYSRFTKLLRRRVPPAVRAEWQEAPRG